MLAPFSNKTRVADIQALYGFNEVFEHLASAIHRRNNIQLIGIRRSGKTSLLNCLSSFFQKSPDSNIFPVYYDFKEVASEVKGTANVYRYCISRVIVDLKNVSLLDESSNLNFRGQNIKQTKIWEDIFLDLQSVPDMRVSSIFEDMISKLSMQLQKTFLFLFDEYEYLFQHSFSAPTGFMKLRKLASNSIGNFSPFMFLVAGTISWEGLCSMTGSGELNCIDHNVFLKPIAYEDFKAMWLTEITRIPNCSEGMKNGFDFAFSSSGGFAFLGKMLGSAWLQANSQPNYLAIKPHLKELYISLSAPQRHILSSIANGSYSQIRASSDLFDLIEKGLIKVDCSTYSITINFLTEFLNRLDSIENNREPTYTEQLSNEIEQLVMDINNTQFNKQGRYIFVVGNNDSLHYKTLSKKCEDRVSCSLFASSLYLLFWDRTKTTANGKTHHNLPPAFKNTTTLIPLINTFRHTMSAHHLDSYTSAPGQISKPDMLFAITGSKNEPRKPEDFQNLQIKFLELCKKEMERLLAIVETAIVEAS